MIYGLIPVGGKGTRLSIPFSKEMLPQKNYDYYNPIINHLVEKMQIAGADLIYFVHGKKLKSDIVSYFSDSRYVHITQKSLGFSRVLHAFYNSIKEDKSDYKIIFGLPDVYFDGNPFFPLLRESGITCGLFETNDATKVDRLVNGSETFDVKSIKKDDNSKYFWGVLKFDAKDFKKIIKSTNFRTSTEIGGILNNYKNKTFVQFQKYIDLGTWDNLNLYWSDSNDSKNREIERKYDALKIETKDFNSFFSKRKPLKHSLVNSWDYYFHPPSHRNIEFIRYREKDKENKDSIPDLTVKSFSGKSAINRYELTVRLSEGNESEDVLNFLQILGVKYAFKVKKECSIFEFEDYTVVIYEILFCGRKIKFIEIELHNSKNLNKLYEVENLLTQIKGFQKENLIKSSKFETLSKIYDTLISEL